MRTVCSLACLVAALFHAPPHGVSQPLRLWDVKAHQETNLFEISTLLIHSEMVLVGEQHGRSTHHMAQLRIIEVIHESKKPVAVGLEMFRHKNQAVLDRWIRGDMDENEIKEHFQRNWGFHWPLYAEIFQFCREKAIPMVGLNVPREVTAQVAREGFDSLSPEQTQLLPQITCQVDPEYEAFIREAYGFHSEGTDFLRFCEAQLVWDTAMAVHALEYLRKNPGHTLVILAGFGHAWKKGIPTQITKRKQDAQQLVILPEVPGSLDRTGAGADDCDYLLLGMQPSP